MAKSLDSYYEEYTVTTSFVKKDVGFSARYWKLELLTGTGPVEYSFNGNDTHGKLGPAGTRPRTVEDPQSSSQISFKSSAGGELVAITARR